MLCAFQKSLMDCALVLVIRKKTQLGGLIMDLLTFSFPKVLVTISEIIGVEGDLQL